jgi:hypothetical protein
MPGAASALMQFMAISSWTARSVIWPSLGVVEGFFDGVFGVALPHRDRQLLMP